MTELTANMRRGLFLSVIVLLATGVPALILLPPLLVLPPLALFLPLLYLRGHDLLGTFFYFAWIAGQLAVLFMATFLVFCILTWNAETASIIGCVPPFIYAAKEFRRYFYIEYSEAHQKLYAMANATFVLAICWMLVALHVALK